MRISWKSFLKYGLAICSVAILIHYRGDVFGSGNTFSVTVVGTTNTQAILQYTAPDDSACVIQVSQDNSYSPVVHDVDATLFSGSNLDSRSTNLGSGANRIVVIGKRSADLALDGLRYSRALQANTTHYFQITCGGETGSGSFTTQNIPLGNTYNEGIQTDPTIAGSIAWPSFDSALHGQAVVDPQTGLLIKNVTALDDEIDNSTWDASASAIDQCESTIVENEDDDEGYFCFIGGKLWWLNKTTLDMVYVTDVIHQATDTDNWQTGGCYALYQDIIDPKMFFCVTRMFASQEEPNKISFTIARMDFVGDVKENDVGFTMPECGGAVTNDCLRFTNLVPIIDGYDLDEMATDFDSHYPDVGFIGAFFPAGHEGRKIMFHRARGGQNTLAYDYVYDVGNALPLGQGGTGAVVAGMNSWSGSVARWCGDHGSGPIVNSNGWMLWYFINFQGGGSAGSGPYETALASDITSGATSITVTGEPLDPSPIGGEDDYLQDAQVGDVFQVGTGNFTQYELVQIVAKSGNNWTVERRHGYSNQYTSPKAWPAGTTLTAYCTGISWEELDLTHAMFWDYLNDPHGLNSGEDTVVIDNRGFISHSSYRGNTYIEITPSDYTSYRYRSGLMPDVIDAPFQEIGTAKSFAGVENYIFSNDMDAHPAPAFEDEFFLDGRVLQGFSTATGDANHPATDLAGSLYKFTSNAWGGVGTQIDLSPKLVPTIAFSNNNVLRDVSGPDSVITGDGGDAYKYCIVKNAGECVSGSSVGDVYVNSPTATLAYCTYPGISIQGWGLQDICIADSAQVLNNIIQIKIEPDPLPGGLSIRNLTKSFMQYRRQDVYWNARVTPDGNAMFLKMPESSAYGNLSDQVLIAKLPPLPTDDGVDRTTFLPLALDLDAPAGEGITGVTVKFGYDENGDPDDYFCTSRQEACVKGNHSTGDFGYETETITPAACTNSSCSITLPVVPERITYYLAEFRDAHGDVVDTQSGIAAETDYANLTAPEPEDDEDDPSPSSSGGSRSGGNRRSGVYTLTAGNVLVNSPILGAEPVLKVVCPYFTEDKRYQSKGFEVRKIQEFLRLEVNPKLPVSGSFGPLTTQAVRDFQAKYSDDILYDTPLRKTTGNWAPKTMKKANQLLGCE